MKKLIYIFAILFAFNANAQNYSDTSITVQLPQRFAFYIARHIESNLTVQTRTLPDVLKPYLGGGKKLDSLFTVTFSAGLLRGGLEQLLTSPLLVVLDDYNKTINNSPAIPGYTSLATQIVQKANGTSNQKAVAQWLLDWYNERVANFSALLNENRQRIVNW
jgi:hypothetical protein